MVTRSATDGLCLLSRLGAPPGLEPPPGLSQPTCLAEAIKEEERVLRLGLMKLPVWEAAGCVPASPMVKQVHASPDLSYSHTCSTSASDPGDDSYNQESPPPCLLRSSVLPWMPLCPAASLAWRARRLTGPHQPLVKSASSERMSYLAEIAAEMLRNTAKDADIHCRRELRGWGVIARVSADELARSAEPLLAARLEVMRHMSATSGTIALRFRVKTQGFRIAVGFVENEYEACWDAMETGQCCRGQTCRREHPRNIQHLFVAMKLRFKGANLQGGEEGQESEEAAVIG
uniref:C3H1-type domain-containing protein n=1 Tax=Alexandrium monilatum TaxID=311494 RepID=A0A7S4SLH6_9DINO